MADSKIGWEAELKALAGQYPAGEAAVSQRRQTWHRCVPETLLPTLERAADALRKGGLANATAKRIVFGKHIEAVQLYTGEENGGGQFLEKSADGKPALVIEVGATLG